MKIRGKPSLEGFLQGGDESGAQPTKAPTSKSPSSGKAKREDADAVPIVKVARIKKLFELPEPLIADLEQRCVDERRQLGRRVTQMEIVERALRTYLSTKP